MSLGLPLETLARIFVHCLPGRSYTIPRIRDAPLLLMQVCRHWKEVAIATPQLWCRLNAIHDYGSDVPLPQTNSRDVMGYATWLSRSGNCPLSLATSFDANGHNGRQWLSFLLHHRKRLHRLWVVDEEEFDLNAFLDGADALNTLHIEGRAETQVNLVITHHPIASLRTLVVENLFLRSDALTSMAWANLSHLAVKLPSSNGYQMRDFVSLISCCPNLQMLIFGDLTHGGPPTPLIPASYSNLRSLSIILDPTSDFDDVPAALILPGLRSLQVKLGDYPPCLDEALVEEDLDTMTPPNRVCFLDIDCEEAFLLFDLSWGGITRLEVEVDGAVDVLNRVLDLCPNLQHLILIIRRPTQRPTSLSSPVTHGSLSVLSMHMEGPLGNFFENATLPTLQRLAIGAACCGEHSAVYAFLDRSRCPLQFLEICTGKRSTAWTVQEQLDFFASTPTLTDLQLRPRSYDEANVSL